jgi:predicted nucleic acid-binding Zn ribbon protein
MSGQAEFDRRRKQRNLAIALGLGALAILFFVLTLFKFAGHG